MMGGWAGAHRVEMQMIKVDDPPSPLTKSFGPASFERDRRARRGHRQTDLGPRRRRGSPGNRGINYWESRDRADRRLIFAAGGSLRAIDARTGKAIRTFGVDRRVTMRDGPLRPLGGPSGTPGRVFENLFLTGSNTGELFGSPPGDIRAFDKDTGKVLWERELEANPGGIAAVYQAGGRQFVVFCASGSGNAPAGNIAFVPGRPDAQGYYVFGLPRKGRLSNPPAGARIKAGPAS